MILRTVSMASHYTTQILRSVKVLQPHYTLDVGSLSTLRCGIRKNLRLENRANYLLFSIPFACITGKGKLDCR